MALVIIQFPKQNKTKKKKNSNTCTCCNEFQQNDMVTSLRITLVTGKVRNDVL